MKKLERMDGELFKNISEFQVSNLSVLLGGEHKSTKDNDTKVSDMCDRVGEKGDKGCTMVGERDTIKSDCDGHDKLPSILVNPDDYFYDFAISIPQDIYYF